MLFRFESCDILLKLLFVDELITQCQLYSGKVFSAIFPSINLSLSNQFTTADTHTIFLL
jgi:hypothetical protein